MKIHRPGAVYYRPLYRQILNAVQLHTDLWYTCTQTRCGKIQIFDIHVHTQMRGGKIQIFDIHVHKCGAVKYRPLIYMYTNAVR